MSTGLRRIAIYFGLTCLGAFTPWLIRWAMQPFEQVATDPEPQTASTESVTGTSMQLEPVREQYYNLLAKIDLAIKAEVAIQGHIAISPFPSDATRRSYWHEWRNVHDSHPLRLEALHELRNVAEGKSNAVHSVVEQQDLTPLSSWAEQALARVSRRTRELEQMERQLKERGMLIADLIQREGRHADICVHLPTGVLQVRTTDGQLLFLSEHKLKWVREERHFNRGARLRAVKGDPLLPLRTENRDFPEEKGDFAQGQGENTNDREGFFLFVSWLNSGVDRKQSPIAPNDPRLDAQEPAAAIYWLEARLLMHFAPDIFDPSTEEPVKMTPILENLDREPRHTEGKNNPGIRWRLYATHPAFNNSGREFHPIGELALENIDATIEQGKKDFEEKWNESLSLSVNVLKKKLGY